MSYEPTLASLRSHPVPAWYEDAKFGIFVHWGLFSVPAFASRLGSISDVFKSHYRRAVTLTPYTEWYENAIKTPDSPSAEFHREQYGAASYDDFREPFGRGLEQWDPADWARTFRQAGARYVVLVTKHHDGFCLWPTGVPNPHREGWSLERDVVGELACAVRAEGMRFGVYYSGGIDWSFNPRAIRTLGEFVGSVPGGDYPEYAWAQVRELVDRYRPCLLWNDISWPTGRRRLLELFAGYYDDVADGLVNDRWVHMTPLRRLASLRPVQLGFDLAARLYLKLNPAGAEGVMPPVPAHCDFRTPEYTTFDEITAKKWEATRGISHSFGYNRNDTEEHYESAEELIRFLVDVVSKNGNVLLNVGPRGVDARIPSEQLERLREVGRWLERNGAAVYGTRPWQRASGQTADGLAVRFTAGPDGLNLILLGTPGAAEVRVRDLSIAGEATHLADGSPVSLRAEGADLVLGFRRAPEPAPAHVVAIRTARSPGAQRLGESAP